jgi:DNA-binding IclR family transcriptional regulator
MGERRNLILQRVVTLLDYCEAHPRRVTLAGVAERLGCHPRHARRYLEALEATGRPVPDWRKHRDA